MPDYMTVAIRAVLAYITLFTMTRLMGKREVSQLTFFDYVTGITIGTVAGSMAIDTTKAFTTILPALMVFGLFQIIASFIALKSRGFRRLADGRATTLIRNGKVLEKNLKKVRLNMDELASKLRDKNVFKLADVEFAFLETDGKVSVLKKTNKQPITPYDLGVPTTYSGVGTLVIEEGRVINEKLREYGLTRAWLTSKLASQGVYDISKVMFAQVDSTGNLYIDLYDDEEKLYPKNYSNKIILAKLSKVQSDFETYYTETNNEEARKLYQSCSNTMDYVAKEFDRYVNKKEKQDNMKS